MNVPRLEKPDRYVGLYVVDFGDHCGVGFTAREVAELLESEKYREIKVLKIHRAGPDGSLELKGMPHATFALECGMFFHTQTEPDARGNYTGLVTIAVTQEPPCNAKVHLARYEDGTFVTALIYPAEYDDEISAWLIEGRYHASGSAEGGVDAVRRYYDQGSEVLDHHQLYGHDALESRSGLELLTHLKQAVQR